MFQPQYESDNFGWIDIQEPTSWPVAIRRYKLATPVGFPCRIVELDDESGEFIRVVSEDEVWRVL